MTRRLPLLVVFCLLTVLVSGAPAQDAATFRVGFAKVDITPDTDAMPVTLNGYGARGGRPATGVLDPIFARAVVVTDPDGRSIALVATDLCFINSEVRDAVVKQLTPAGFGEHNVMISSTHTHAGPSAYDRRYVAKLVMGPYDRRIFDQVVGGIVEAVRRAAGRRQPATLRQDISELPGMNRSRRDPAFDVAVGGGAGLSVDPNKYPTDRRLTLLRADDTDGKPLGLLVHFAAHPTVLSLDNMLVSADWPGAMNAELERGLGPDTVSMFVNGSLGDAAPLPNWTTPRQEIQQVKEYGGQMAAAVQARLGKLRPVADATVAGFTNRANFDRLVLNAAGGLPLNRNMTKLLVLRHDQPLQALRIGRLVILGVPGEPTTLAGASFEQLCGEGFHCLTAGPVNGYLGYFVTPVEYDEGGYAPSSCFWGRDTAAKIKKALGAAAVVVQSQQ